MVSKEHRQSILSKYTIKPQGKPTLAPEDDARPAMELRRVSAEEAFGGGDAYTGKGGK
jgi:DNA-directed RNA polymerase subunit H (RpoH/RPB5)